MTNTDMYIMNDDTAWCAVQVYGPKSQITHLKRLCITPNLSGTKKSYWDFSIRQLFPTASSSFPSVQASRFEARPDHDSNHYAFKFDTSNQFPSDVFKHLAVFFTELAFDCDCIDSLDEFMGYGWFNPPSGGENFRQNMRVPSNYWTTGPGFKRSPAKQKMHQDRIAKLLMELRNASSKKAMPTSKTVR